MTPYWCDFKDVLYAIDNSTWYTSVNVLLSLLGCPINKIKKNDIMSIKNYLYIELSINKYLSEDEKFCLNNIISISPIHLLYNQTNFRKCYAIDLNTNNKDRTEVATDIAKIFFKVVDKSCVLIFRSSSSFAMTGTWVNDESNNLEVVISEWFDYNMTDNQYERLQEIDLTSDYLDYVYSIARPYQKYKESKIYLKYGLIGYKVKGKVDINEIYDDALNYYRVIYGYDYYEDFIFDYEENEDEEMEWTLLELGIDSLTLDNEFDSYNDPYDEVYEYDEDDELILNEELNELECIKDPEEMLKFIRLSKNNKQFQDA